LGIKSVEMIVAGRWALPAAKRVATDGTDDADFCFTCGEMGLPQKRRSTERSLPVAKKVLPRILRQAQYTDLHEFCFICGEIDLPRILRERAQYTD
jgi:hypothetical protein